MIGLFVVGYEWMLVLRPDCQPIRTTVTSVGDIVEFEAKDGSKYTYMRDRSPFPFAAVHESNQGQEY